MQKVIDTICRQLNPVLIHAEMDKIRAIKLDMRDIRVSIQSLNDQLNVWEKLNPFVQSEEKQELRYLKDELKFYKQELKNIKDGLRREIRAIIESTPSLRMKVTVSAMEEAISGLLSKLKKKGGHHINAIRKSAEMQALNRHVHELDVIIENEFGFKRGIFQEHEMVEAVLNELLERRVPGK